jgi:FkbM family methyltransferase
MVARQPSVAAVYSFEPHPLIFRCLELNVTHDQRIRPFNKALGRASGAFSMPGLDGPYKRNPAGMRMCEIGQEFLVEAIAIDALQLSGVSLIKIDVEGWEWDVICGATDLIKRERPTLIVEILPDDPRTQRAATIELICGLGYKAEQITAYDLLFTPK